MWRIRRLHPIVFNPDSGEVVDSEEPIPDDRQAAECHKMENRRWICVGEETNLPPYTHLIQALDPNRVEVEALWPWWLAQLEEGKPEWVPLEGWEPLPEDDG